MLVTLRIVRAIVGFLFAFCLVHDFELFAFSWPPSLASVAVSALLSLASGWVFGMLRHFINMRHVVERGGVAHPSMTHFWSL
ncbi:MAG: hypothetical protein ABI671_01545 [Burkholderiales bacterium]